MTSPDGLPLGSYNPQTPAIGDWDFDGLDLVALGDEVLFGPIRQLLSAVTGLPLSTWPTVPDIIDAAKNLLGAIGKGIEQLLSGVIPIGLLSRTTPNLLANGAFDGAVSIVEGEGWVWDELVGRTSPGSARFDASGVAGVQLSTPVQVAEGQKLACEGWVKWSGVAAAAGSGFRIERRWYDGTTLVSTDLVAETLDPPASGGWSRLSDEVTTSAGVDTVCLALVVDAGVSVGQVWFDDAALTKPTTSLPQQWISGLVDELGALGDDVAAVLAWVKDLIEKLTGRAWSTITDAVAGVQTFAEQLKTILSGGVVSSPLPSLVGSTIREARTMIEQIAGIAAGDPVTPINSAVQAFKNGWTSTTGWIQDLIDAVLRAIRRVPVVGGSLADIIAEVGGLNDRTDAAKTKADEVQTGIVEGWTGGSTTGADPDVFDTMAAIKAMVGGDGYTRVNITATTTWTKPAGTTEVIVVGIAAGQNGAKGSAELGGNGGQGGGHKAQALDPSEFSSLGVIVGTNGAATQFRLDGTSGVVLSEAVIGGLGAMATSFGYTGTNSQGGAGGAGGRGHMIEGDGAAPGTGGAGTPAATAGAGSNTAYDGGAEATAGGSVPVAAVVPCGGGGGGGGGGGSASLGKSKNGRPGGAGGFPGGGGGGGGGRGNGGLSGIGSVGSGGTGGAGLAIIFYR